MAIKLPRSRCTTTTLSRCASRSIGTMHYPDLRAVYCCAWLSSMLRRPGSPIKQVLTCGSGSEWAGL